MKLHITQHAKDRLLERVFGLVGTRTKRQNSFAKKTIEENLIIPEFIVKLIGTKIIIKLESFESFEAVCLVEEDQVKVVTIQTKDY